MLTNFLKRLISHLAPDVFRPAPTGLLYLTYQAVSREISGECPWDTGDDCYKNFTGFWYPKCRSIFCPGYRHPVGLIAYTSRSSLETEQAPIVSSSVVGEYLSTDNRFDYSSFRYLSTLPSATDRDWIPVGTLGAEIKFDFGFEVGDVGGFGANWYGGLYFGINGIFSPSGMNVVIGDKWYIKCDALTGDVGPAIPDPANTGAYAIVTTRTGAAPTTRGSYSGPHNTVYTVEIVDFSGYVQNFQNAILQICLATATEEWLDYWGDYFGIPRLLLSVSGGGKTWETDPVYRARIMKEITRAKGTKPVLLEEAINYFHDSDVKIIEYQKPPVVTGTATGGSATTLVDGGFVAAGVLPGLEVLNLTTGKKSYVVGVGATILTLFAFDGFSPGDQYSVIGAMDNFNAGTDPDDPITYPDSIYAGTNGYRLGLWPYEFYIYPPTIKKPSAKWVKTGANLMIAPQGTTVTSDEAQVWQMQSYDYTPYGAMVQLLNVDVLDEVCDPMLYGTGEINDCILFGCKNLFSGVRIVLASEFIKYSDDPPAPPPIEYYWSGGKKYEARIPTDGGVGGTYIWEYWNGSNWTAIFVSDTTFSGPTEFAQDGWVSWIVPSDWAKADDDALARIPNTGIDRYWIRVRVLTPPTVIPSVDYVGIVYAGSTARGCYCATQELGFSIEKQPVLVSGTAYDGSNVQMIDNTKNFIEEGVQVGDVIMNLSDQSYSTITLIDSTPGFLNNRLNFGPLTGATSFSLGKLYGVTSYFKPSIYDTVPTGGGVSTTVRDANNIYIYYGKSWERPDWQGLQDIIDRLKTAGTIAIINPRFGG